MIERNDIISVSYPEPPMNCLAVGNLALALPVVIALVMSAGCSSGSSGESMPTPPAVPESVTPENGDAVEGADGESDGGMMPIEAETDPETGGDEGGDGSIPDSTSPSELDLTFSDEFETDTLDQWMLRHEVENTSPQFSILDINDTTTGALTIVPSLTPGWFAAGDAPLVFKSVSGDFTVETSVSAESTSTPGLAPSEEFNSAGLMARNSGGAMGPENYIMVNVGYQSDALGVGSETKSTLNSNSRLELQRGTNRGRLILCRIGNEFTAWRMLDNETTWTLISERVRDDLPQTLQVGLVANGFTGPDLKATFDYIRLRVPMQRSQCTPEE